MDEEAVLARREGGGEGKLLDGTGSGSSGRKRKARDKRKKEIASAQGGQGCEISDIEKESKDKAEADGRDGSDGGREECGLDNTSGGDDRESEGGDRAARRSAKKLDVVWHDHKCNLSPNGAHHFVAALRANDGVIFICKYCYVSNWYPIYFRQAAEMARLMDVKGKQRGYVRMMSKRNIARTMLDRLASIPTLARSLPEAEYMPILGAILSSCEEHDFSKIISGVGYAFNTQYGKEKVNRSKRVPKEARVIGMDI